MEAIGGEDLICFVSVEYAASAQAVFDELWFGALLFHNVWIRSEERRVGKECVP